MDTEKRIVVMEDMKVKLSILWIFVMFNMAFADIIGFINPGALEEIMTSLDITQGFMLVAAVLVEIPIAMIVLSRVLKYKANRFANIIAGVITILWVVGGGNTSFSYIFFATVEVLCVLLIIWYAWKWSIPEA
jgi:hypothetical protein